MKSVLLIGLGRFGRHIAKKLNEMDHQVMAVDSDEERVNDVISYVTNAQIGDSTNEQFLSSLGIRNFDTCIVAMARAATDVQEKFLLRNGADEVVYPEKQLASWTAIRCTSDMILDYTELDDGYSIFEIETPESWINKTIVEINIRRKYNINVLAIRGNGKLNMNINPDTRFMEGNSVLILGQQKDVQKCLKI